jgi:Fe(3+) dicitrate transport protein
VPSVWLLAARANYTIPNTNAVIFISGQNLTDEVYITDREDGIKPGIGRTIMAGAKVKWQGAPRGLEAAKTQLRTSLGGFAF